MEKVIIKEIKINGKGKSKEELKAEAMKEIEKQLNDAFKDVKEPKKDEEEPAKLHIHIDEDSDRGGYGCETEICGDVDSVLDMTAVAVATMANQISEVTTLSSIGVIPEVMMRAAHFIMEDEKGEEEK
jgi:hypothetical protein